MNNYKRAISAFLCFLLIVEIVMPLINNAHGNYWTTVQEGGSGKDGTIGGVALGILSDGAVAQIGASQDNIKRAFGRSTQHGINAGELLTVAGAAYIAGPGGALIAAVASGGGTTPDEKLANARKDVVNQKLDYLWALIKDILTWLVAFGEITCILICLLSFFKLATAPAHPIQRRNCMMNIITSIVSGALLGGLALILNIFYGTFANSFNSGVIFASDWRVGGTIFIAQYGNLVAGFSGIVSLTMLLCMGYSFTKLALSGGNPQKKQQAMTSIITTVLATAGVGGVATFVSMLTGILNI